MVEQMIAVVQAYIFHRTEREVIISVSNNEDYMKLSHAYNFAINWFQQNNGQINKI